MELEQTCLSADRGVSGNAGGDTCLPTGRKEHTLHSRGGKGMETRLLPRTIRPMEGNPKGKWTSLIHHLNEDFLKECFQRLKRDAATGVDGVTVREYETNLKDNIKELVARMKAWKYYPQSVNRVYIPEADGSKRPLGIPAVEDLSADRQAR